MKEWKEYIEGVYTKSKISSNDIQNKFVILTLASDVFEIYQIEGKDIHRIFLNPYNHIPLIVKEQDAMESE